MTILEFFEKIISHLLSRPVLIGYIFFVYKSKIGFILESIVRIIEQKGDKLVERRIDTNGSKENTRIDTNVTEEEKEIKIKEDLVDFSGKITNDNVEFKKRIEEYRNKEKELSNKLSQLFGNIINKINPFLEYVESIRIENTENGTFIGDGAIILDQKVVAAIEIDILHKQPLSFFIRRKIERIRYYQLPFKTILVIYVDKIDDKIKEQYETVKEKYKDFIIKIVEENTYEDINFKDNMFIIVNNILEEFISLDSGIVIGEEGEFVLIKMKNGDTRKIPKLMKNSGV